MSLADDPISPTSTSQELQKILQEYGFFDFEKTEMSLSDVHIPSQTSTTQEVPRESLEDFSFLESKETEEEPFKSIHCPISGNPIYVESDIITATTTMNTGGDLFNGSQSNVSLDYQWNMGSQRSTNLIGIIPTPGFVKRNTNNNGQSCLSIEASNNNGRYGTYITDPFGFGSLFSDETSVGMMTNTRNTYPASFQSVSVTSSSLFHQQQQQQRLISHDEFGQNQVASDMVNPSESIHSQTPEKFQLSQFHNQYRNNASSQIPPVTIPSFITPQQIQQMLDLQNMGSGSISVGVRSESGLHGHSQSQSQGHAQMSNSMSNKRHIQEETMSGTHETQPNNMSGGSVIGNLFTGNQSNFPLDYGWNKNSQRNITGFVEASSNSGGYGTNPEVCMMTNTQNNPASFHPVSTSSSLKHQQQQFHQQGVSTEPHWTMKKILNKSDIGHKLYLGKSFVEDYILKHLPKEDGQKILENDPGIVVKVYDRDTYTTHTLSLAFGKKYVLQTGWKKEFVVRRNLHIEEQIGLFWDCSESKLHFSVLSPLQHQQQQFQQHRVLTVPHWTEKKILKWCDISSTLFLHKLFVENHIRKHLPKEDNQKIREVERGITVKAYDHDTHTSHDLFLTVRNQQYILWKGWKKEFVERRRLLVGEEIGLFWNRSDSTLHFHVLSRALL